jgi:hypothetical protein
MSMTFSGQTNQPFFFISGPTLSPANFNVAAFGWIGGGTVDVGSVSPVFNISIVGDGNGGDFWNSLFDTGPTGIINITVPTTGFAPGTQFNVQAVFPNNASVFRMSNAVQVTIL